MKLLFKLLKQNINIWQLVGFVFANLVGAVIVLVGCKAFMDIDKMSKGDDGVLSSGFFVLSKPVNGVTTITNLFGMEYYFGENEIEELKKNSAVKGVGRFNAANFIVDAKVEWKGLKLSTDVFLESVPDEYIDVNLAEIPNVESWAADVNDEGCTIPLIIPKGYVALYNFGYAASRGLPQISEKMLSKFPVTLIMEGNGIVRRYKAQICGYSNRINTVLAPEAFIKDANALFAPDVKPKPKRLIVAVDSSKDSEGLLEYVNEKGYTVEGGEMVRLQSFVNAVLFVIIAIGVLVSLLAFSLLLISILLLIEKNKEKFLNLYSIGYPVAQIAAPYRILVIFVDVAVWIAALAMAMVSYSRFEVILQSVEPEFTASSPLFMIAPAILLSLLFVLIHLYMVGRQIQRICK